MFLAPLAPALIGAAAGLVGALAQGSAAKAAADYNAKVARMQAEQAQAKGNMEAASLGKKQRQAAGKMQSKLGGSGALMNKGNAAYITADTADEQISDQRMLSYNTQMSAWGYNAEAINQEALGKNAMKSAWITGIAGAAGSLATGYMNSTPATGGSVVKG